MTKMWQKGYDLDAFVEQYMTGDDPVLDKELISYDCLGSLAHAMMLQKIGILSVSELEQIQHELRRIISLAKSGMFDIKSSEEDVHTAVENALISTLGELGKKLHTARSRNDQVLLDLRLYMREKSLDLIGAALELCQTLLTFAYKHQYVPIPGRTHFQRAMPSSVGLWTGALLESLLDDIDLIKSNMELIDQCPLGSAASYGVALPIDRQFVSDLLGFRKVQNNVLYANNSRGKFEAILQGSLMQIMLDLSKFATDIILFSAPEFGYFSLPEKLCPGSSLMPQKRNPCPLELIRAKSSTFTGYYLQVVEIIKGLPSGYNRDYQETKRPLMYGINLVYHSTLVFNRIFEELGVNEEACINAFTPELYATDAVLELAAQGTPFRDAYRQVAAHLDKISLKDPVEAVRSKTHLGATGNLNLPIAKQRLLDKVRWLEENKELWQQKRNHLLG